MTIQEIEQTLQSAALSIQQLTQVAVHTDARLDASDSARREADVRIEVLINAQVRYEARQEKIEEAYRLLVDMIRNAQVRYEARQEKAEEACSLLIEMIRLHENRLDRADAGNAHTEARLDALINSQIQLTERVDTLTRDLENAQVRYETRQEKFEEACSLLIEMIRLHENRLDQADTRNANTEARLEETDARLDRVGVRLEDLAELQVATDEKIKALIETQARTDGQIRLLINRDERRR